MNRDKFIELRKARGLTHRQLADLSGVSVDTIARIERPEHPEKDSPRLITLEQICPYLGIEVWELLFPGDRATAEMIKELAEIRSERDALKRQVDDLRTRNDSLKDDLLCLFKHHHEREEGK